MKSIAWIMPPETAAEFFLRCHERNANTEPERVAILMELAKEGKTTSVTATKKSKDEYIADKAKHFRILKIKKEDK